MKNNIILVLFFCTAFTLHAQIGNKNFIDQPYIEVIGTAEMEVVPDEIVMRVFLDENDNKRYPLEVMEKRMISALDAIGLDVNNDVKVKDQASIFKKKIFSRDILLSKEFMVTVHSPLEAQRVFEELTKIDISNISIVKLTHSKITDYKQEIQQKAIRAAHKKAKILSESIGQYIGRALYIEEQPYRIPESIQSNVMHKAYSEFKVEAKGTQGDYQFENIQLKATFLCRFELK